MLPTNPPSIAPKIAPIPKRKNPPAPPEIIPHRSPRNGSAKSIQCQDRFSSSVTILPMSLPEKNPTVADVMLTKKNKTKNQASSDLIPPESIRSCAKKAAGGNAPSIKPK